MVNGYLVYDIYIMIKDNIQFDKNTIWIFELSKKINISYTTIRNILFDKKNNIEKLRRVYIYYKVDYDEYWYKNQIKWFPIKDNSVWSMIRQLRINKSYWLLYTANKAKISLKTMYNIEVNKWWLYNIKNVLNVVCDDLQVKDNIIKIYLENK